MVRIIFSSSFYWYYIHGSTMFIAHIKNAIPEHCMYRYVKIQGVKASKPLVAK